MNPMYRLKNRSHVIILPESTNNSCREILNRLKFLDAFLGRRGQDVAIRNSLLNTSELIIILS